MEKFFLSRRLTVLVEYDGKGDTLTIKVKKTKASSREEKD
jgi:hypothetical protein